MSDTDQQWHQLKGYASELWDRLAAVQALHGPVIQHGRAHCLECTRDPAHPVAWPCDTVLAARGDAAT